MAEELLGARLRDPRRRLDLVFPHHENEIAQTEAARGEPLAKLWMHNGMVQAPRSDDAKGGDGAGEGDKMAKSVGNVFLLGEAVEPRCGGRDRVSRLRSLPPADRLRAGSARAVGGP